MADAPRLDAPRHVAGLQCERRLWLAVHQPERAAPDRRAPERAANARARAELCALAAQRFGAELADAGPDPVAAEQRTRAWLAAPGPRALAGACVGARSALARADFLERRDAGGLALHAVCAALRPSESALDELAFAWATFRAAGVELRSAELLVLDGERARGAGAPVPPEVFRRRDVTRDVAALAHDVPARLAAQCATLALPLAPEIEPSPHCRRPEPCPFFAFCTRDKPADWIGFLPGLRVPQFAALREAGAERAADVPADFELTPAQRNFQTSHARGGAFAAPELSRRLEGFGPPADFLDFEAILPELPLFAGTRPFEVVPFQFSAHLARDGGLEHAEFLAEHPTDPRRELALRLIEVFGRRALPIVVYSGFEAEVLIALGRAFPDLAAELERLGARLRDLLPVVRRSVYVPAFGGSFSLKSVAPALRPGFGFDDLEGIADGGAAARAWLALARGELDAATARARLAELRAYCARDSLALAELLGALRELAAQSAG